MMRCGNSIAAIIGRLLAAGTMSGHAGMAEHGVCAQRPALLLREGVARRAARTVVFAVIIACIASTSCSEASAPSAAAESVIVLGGEAGHFTVVDLHRGRIVGEIGPIPRIQNAYARSPDGSTLYVTASDGSGGQLLAVDMRSLAIRWHEALPDGNQFNGLVVAGDYGLAISPDGDRIFLASAMHGTAAGASPGIGVLDAATREPIGFVGPMWVQPGGLVTLPAGPAAPEGAILIVGRRQRHQTPSLDWLFTLDPSSLEIRDSVAIAPASSNDAPTLLGAVPSPDRRHVYVAGVDQLYGYDLVEHRIVASTPLPAHGALSVSPDGQTLYLTDAGDFFDSPGSGFIHVYDADLDSLPSIDLQAARVNGIPLATQDAVVGRDKTLLYVSAGTASRGPLYGPQPGQVLVIDLATGELLRSVPLNDWAPAGILLR